MSSHRLIRIRSTGFEWRSWQGTAVVYDLRSGDTHRIAHPSGHVLSALLEAESGALPLDRLAERLAGAGTGTDPGRIAAVTEALRELGVIEVAAADCRS